VRYKKICLLLFFLLAISAEIHAQRYNFEHYDIDKGLIQSQVNDIAQDKNRRLWAVTLGGISSFNGKQFTNFTKANGLGNNFVTAISIDKNDKLWIGTASGITTYDGIKFNEYNKNFRWVFHLKCDQNGDTYAMIKNRVVNVTQKRPALVQVSPDKSELISCINTDKNGRLWAAVYRKGVYFLENKTWKAFPINDTKIENIVVYDIIVDRFVPNKIWLQTPDGIFTTVDGKLQLAFPEIKERCSALLQDHNGTMWIGTNRGMYRKMKERLTYFHEGNGFTSNKVNKIFEDAENNIWFGTDGEGILKFKSTNYVSFDETQGLKNKIVMSLCNGATPNTIWMGTYGGIFEWNAAGKVKAIPLPLGKNDDIRINFLFMDSKKNIWIGTPTSGLWIYNANRFNKLLPREKSMIAFNGIMEDSNGLIWLNTSDGLYTYNVGTKIFDKVNSQFSHSFVELGRDSVMIATQDGAFLVLKQKKIEPLNIKELKGSGVLCMYKYGKYVLIGTTDYGLMIWNSKDKTVQVRNATNGLASDHIYSIYKDNKEVFWIGTGRGVNKVLAKNFQVVKKSAADSLLVECNQNAILQYHDFIWVGTTRGAIVFKHKPADITKIKPYIFINSAITSSNDRSEQNTTIRSEFKNESLNDIPQLPYSSNNITISYTGIYLTNPNSIIYKSRLVGLTNNFSSGTPNTSMNYSALPAGKYTFEVMAITKDLAVKSNVAMFSFEILPPYYQTALFRTLMILLIVATVISGVFFFLRLNERRRKFRLKIKLEEQHKIRKQTAEDFHDDLGNKLTRITVLSEVLKSMIDENDVEKRNILKKIGNNINELYSGTKDILWSLNPKNDTLPQLLAHIKDFGIEMFNDTSVKFSYDIDETSTKIGLPINVNRNVLMIFKEVIHNALKHSKATEVQFKAKLSKDLLLMSLEDNGIGFDINDAKNGHGMNNMYVRAARINADLSVVAEPDGTVICLLLNFSTLEETKNV
jgi:ligand-binding sensor domain-containing protein/signal transduction histidine kinase